MHAAALTPARELMTWHLERIEAVNPRVNAIVTLRPEAALVEAAAADERATGGGERLGPLHGLPIAIKDLEETAGIRTTYGSAAFADNVPAVDSLVVQRLMAAGAIVLGKTNTPEFGVGSHTFNEVFGALRRYAVGSYACLLRYCRRCARRQNRPSGGTSSRAWR